MKPESRFYGRINRRLPKSIKIEKMHNIYRGGTADHWYSGYKSDLWIEYKWLSKLPVRVPVRPDLSALQLLWLNDHHVRGRNVGVIIGAPAGCAILLNGEWNQDVAVSSFRFSEASVAAWIIEKVDAQAIVEGYHGN